MDKATIWPKEESQIDETLPARRVKVIVPVCYLTYTKLEEDVGDSVSIGHDN